MKQPRLSQMVVKRQFAADRDANARRDAVVANGADLSVEKKAMAVYRAVAAFERLDLLFDGFHNAQSKLVGAFVGTIPACVAGQIHQRVDTFIDSDKAEQTNELVPMKKSLTHKKVRFEKGDFLRDKSDFCLHEPAGRVDGFGQTVEEKVIRAGTAFGDFPKPYTRQGKGAAAHIQPVVAACDAVLLADARPIIGIESKRGIGAAQRAGNAADREIVRCDGGVVQQRQVGDRVLQLGQQLDNQLACDGLFRPDVGMAEAVADDAVKPD